MHHHTERSFVDEFRWVSPLQYLKNGWQTLFFFGACCKRGRHFYTTTAPSCCIPASYCHLSVTLQTMSIIVVNLQDNRAAFQIFIALLSFSFDSPSYFPLRYASCCCTHLSKFLHNLHEISKMSSYNSQGLMFKSIQWFLSPLILT